MSATQEPGILRSTQTAWPRSSLIAAVGASLLPLLGMAVCARPAWDWQRTERELSELRERVGLADKQAFRHNPVESRKLIAAAEQVQQEILALLPASFDRIELFSMLREYAGEVQIGLQTLQLGKDIPLGLADQNLDVARLELELRGSGEFRAIGDLLASFDQAGLPADVLQLTVAIRPDGQFDLALQLGLFHWIPAEATAAITEEP